MRRPRLLLAVHVRPGLSIRRRGHILQLLCVSGVGVSLSVLFLGPVSYGSVASPGAAGMVSIIYQLILHVGGCLVPG